MIKYQKNINKRCIWCLESEDIVSFNKKAHTIPKSLGGQNYNKYVCDTCNEYFGATSKLNKYSIEEALKETFCISRQIFLNKNTKRKVGNFKSKFFEVKERNGKLRLGVKTLFKFNSEFQKEFCRNFKRGLIKMWFEEFDRQTKHLNSCDIKYQVLRNFSRYNIGEFPVLYFKRKIGIFILSEREAETPVLVLGRMKYLLENDKFTEIEFLGHVFGFPYTECTEEDFQKYIQDSLELKKDHFSEAIMIDKLIDIDFALTILNK